METYSDEILKRIKSSIGISFYKLISIEKIDELNHKVIYIDLGYRNNTPIFSIRYAFFDFKVELRDSRIDLILNDKQECLDDIFDVESVIYSDEQRKTLERLRMQKTKNGDELNDAKIEYSNSFKVGEHVYYNGYHGIITFKHKSKTNLCLWTVKVGNTEYRYVEGIKLKTRKVRDLSKMPLDEKLNKLSTEKLLKMYKRSLVVNKGIGNIEIKRILNEREHVQKGENIIINIPH